MPRDRGEPPAVRIYTVCDESRYLIVRNVPALGCGDELLKLFGSYGEIEECKPMDAEDCEPFTDVYWIKFSQVGNARFAKRKLDESVFLGNRLQVSYAPQFESLLDTKEKLEGRRKEVLGRVGRIEFGKMGGSSSQLTNYSQTLETSYQHLPTQAPSESNSLELQISPKQRNYCKASQNSSEDDFISHVSSNKEYFASASMNETVRLVRGKLDKIHSSSEAAPASKRTRPDNRRRI
ncbi:RNA-binding protein 48-like isoform X2 [Phoenix dactylifera]|uniref:RNA-binding protein 48 n=1 Tax=Phoenix dactylifera TaxID=42345 RepID=A0A8B8ZI92_PHODC|nr:RNA-binding protein 48-like isoform X2 [Phoenix dactylifera]